MTQEKADELKIQPLAKVISWVQMLHKSQNGLQQHQI